MGRPSELKDPITKTIVLEKADFEYLLKLSYNREISKVIRNMINFYKKNNEQQDKFSLHMRNKDLEKEIIKLKLQLEKINNPEIKEEDPYKLVISESDQKILDDPTEFLRLYKLCSEYTISQDSFIKKTGMSYFRAGKLIVENNLE